MGIELTPTQTRAQDPLFAAECSLSGLQHRLPLRWSIPPDIPPSPKRAYRSHYVYLGWQELQEATAWQHLQEFDLILRLVDFSGLRPLLAHLLDWTSARGWCPFDPVSMFLLHGWQLTNQWKRAQTLKHLHDPRYADYAHSFGFENGVFPSEGGMRYFLSRLGSHSDAHNQPVRLSLEAGATVEVAVHCLNHLIVASVDLFRQANLLSPAAWSHARVCPDGMIHDAASCMHCNSTQPSCYQLTTSQQPRPCPAQAKDRRGCQCDTSACAQICRYATPRDPDARFIWYSGSNQTAHNPNQPIQPSPTTHQSGEPRYGYRSLPLELADPARRFSLILLDHFQPANEHEENPAAALLLQLPTFYPTLHLDTVAGDAGFGYEVFLHAVYQLGAKRAIDLRAHQTDKDKSLWPIRGYDDKGRPVCSYGYPFIANGFDALRQRHKWFCGQTCLHGTAPAVNLDQVNYPPTECPFLSSDAHPHGQIKNVAERFDDASIRLVRDLPFGTPTWKRFYHQARNAAESRNAAFERWRLKRLSVYGTPCSKAITFQADVWLNLTTLARLVQEATTAAIRPP